MPMLTTLLKILPILPSTHAFTLLVSSYKAPNVTLGTLQTLTYDYCTASLDVTSSSRECGALPSWLELSSDRSSVTCVNENDPGSLTLFNINDRGGLQKVSNTSTLGGPVSATYYGNGTGLAVAHVRPLLLPTLVFLMTTSDT